MCSRWQRKAPLQNDCGVNGCSCGVLETDWHNVRVKRLWLNLLIPPDVGQAHRAREPAVNDFTREIRRKKREEAA